MPGNHREVRSQSRDLGAVLLLMLGCPVLTTPNPRCFSLPRSYILCGFMLSTLQTQCIFHQEQPCAAWVVTYYGCTCHVLSVREESRGLQAALCLSAAFWMLCNLCWSEPMPGDSGRLEPGSCEIHCVHGEQAGNRCLLLYLELMWCRSLFWAIAALLNPCL